ncbi:MAG: MBL fold metallo-hydrolase [Planctomycetota bacterium]
MSFIKRVAFVCFALVAGVSDGSVNAMEPATRAKSEDVQVIVLGIAQDAGFLQAACRKRCCADAWKDPSLRRHASCLAIVDHATDQRWLVECTPNFPEQLKALDRVALPKESTLGIDGIFLTHAHIGHYAGLIHLGREVTGSSGIPVHAMPRMSRFLQTNGPWSQLVRLGNIRLRPLGDETVVRLNERITVRPFLVPHRDEFSETVGFVISGPSKTVVFIPDIDKWSRWDRRIEDMITACDIAFLDGTFFNNGEIPGRDMSLIPHPFIRESIQRFSTLDRDTRDRIHFIHLNHTNPALIRDSSAAKQIKDAGMQVAEEGQIVDL